MRLGTLDIIGRSAEYGKILCLRLAQVAPQDKNELESFSVELDERQTEYLITYLKGLRDGLGWNKKSNSDRSL